MVIRASRGGDGQKTTGALNGLWKEKRLGGKENTTQFSTEKRNKRGRDNKTKECQARTGE